MTPIKLQPQTFLTLPFSETELPLTPFDITRTHSPTPLPQISDPSDIDPLHLRNINKPILFKTILIPTSRKRRRRNSQLGPSLPITQPCSHTPPLPTGVDSTTFSLIYPRLPPSKSASKHTPSSLDNLLDTFSNSTIRRLCHRYYLRYNCNLALLLPVQNPLC